jgi:hypothetical protein
MYEHLTDVHAAGSLTTGALSWTTAFTDPPSVRQLAIAVTSGTQAVTGTVAITGTDWAGTAQSESVTISATGGATTVQYTSKAFATVTAVTGPARTNTSGDSISLGYADSLFTLAEARAFDKLQLANATDYPAATIYAKADEIAERFERICGVAFLPKLYVEYLSGDGTATMLLSAHNPLAESAPRPVEMYAVTVDGTALTATELASVYADTGGLTHYVGGPWSTASPHNIKAKYYAGWSVVPFDIKRAALIVAVNELPPDNISDRVTSFSDGSANYQMVTAGVRGAATSLPEVNAILQRYNETRPGIA